MIAIQLPSDKFEDMVRKVLWDDYDAETEFPQQTPLLAHYTTMQNFDAILSNNQLWLSNPLYMNDLDELTFGMNKGADRFRTSKKIYEACGDNTTYNRLLVVFNSYFSDFDKQQLINTYVACFSVHHKENYDGLLSMWRGYGANGNGVSFVIDTSKIDPDENSPLILGPVKYASSEKRIEWIDQKINQLAELLTNSPKTDEVLIQIASHWVERLKVFSLFTKHKGFIEEDEWRLVYLSNRDQDSQYGSMYGYYVTEKGVEPKLQLKINELPNASEPMTLESIIDRIILGPTISSEMSKRSLIRMLEIKGKSSLVDKVYASSIPFRA